MKRFALLVIGLALAAPVHAQKAPPVPDLLKRALTPPASKALYAYDFETVSVNADPKKGPQTTTTRGRIDPSRKKGDRVTISFVEGLSEGKPITAKKMDETLEKGADGDIFCDKASKEDVTNVVDKGATPNGHAFTFTPKAEADEDGEMKEIMKKMLGEAVIDEATGLIKFFEGKLQKKHTVMFIAEIKTATMKMECQPAPNGRAYSTRTEFTGIISAFGNTFDTKSVQTISNITPVG